MTSIVPTMSNMGWTDSLAVKADKLFSYYLLANASQSYLYRGIVVSFSNDIAVTDGDSIKITGKVKNSIDSLFKRYFAKVETNVKVLPVSELKPNELNIEITIDVFDQDVRYNLGKLIQVIDSDVRKITDLLN